jgi:peptidoglycan/LPS O-acetylase OafA/YrhL
MKAPDHLPQLDGLRALAVLAVIAEHTLPGPLLLALTPGGAGVRLFFVLSGFLITGILLRAGDLAAKGGSPGSALRAFYARRFLRIFPLYYLALAVALLLGIQGAREGWGWHLAYLTNIYGVRTGWLGYLAHFWSLAVEEQFYLVWPALVLFLPRGLLGPLFVAAAAAGPVSRVVAYLVIGDASLACILTPCCLDSLGLGALLAYAGREWGPAQAGRLAAVSRVVGLPLLLAVNAYRLVGWEGVLTVAFRDVALALLAVWLVHEGACGFRGPAGRFLSCRPLVYLGTISYGVYIWHGLVPAFAEHVAWLPYPEGPGALKFLCVTGAAVVLASLSWHLFEKRLNGLKRYFPYSGRAPAGSRRPGQSVREGAQPVGRPGAFAGAREVSLDGGRARRGGAPCPRPRPEDE